MMIVIDCTYFSVVFTPAELMNSKSTRKRQRQGPETGFLLVVFFFQSQVFKTRYIDELNYSSMNLKTSQNNKIKEF